MATPWRGVDPDFDRAFPGAPASTAQWRDLPAWRLPIASLILTQRGTYFHALDDTTPSYSGDELPHVIDVAGDLYLVDGHHRLMRAVFAGETSLLCRVWAVVNRDETE